MPLRVPAATARSRNLGSFSMCGGREEPLLTQVEPVGEELQLTPEELKKLKAGLKVTGI